jgi:parallel beta-helix repeat protein
MKHFSILCLLLVLTLASYAAVIHVPADQPTIQAAINAAQNGDTVVVAPGTYFENINFSGKAIRVTSSSGYALTIIDGIFNYQSVVTFDTGEGLHSVLDGFTIQHGSGVNYGGGVSISNASPTVSHNLIKNNSCGPGGGGVGLYFSSALIENNVISSNTLTLSGGNGGGIVVVGGAPQILGNTIENNTAPIGSGGGVMLMGESSPTLQNNIIHGNVAAGLHPFTFGGGIYIESANNALLVQNLIYNNIAGQGSGIYLSIGSVNTGSILVNNTIVGKSSSPQGSALYTTGVDHLAQLFNNLMIGASGTNAVYCDPGFDPTPPALTNNDAFSPNGSGFQGTCAAQSGTNGNISANPMFVGAVTIFQLKAGSPAIDAGDNSAPDLPPLDLAGNPRIVDGDGDGTAIIDMGAYEYQPPAPKSVTPARPQ